MNRYAKARSSVQARTFDPTDAASPPDPRIQPATASRRKALEQFEELRRSIAALDTEIDEIAIKAHARSGTVPSAQAAPDFVAEKRCEIQRLNARLEEIERLLSAG